MKGELFPGESKKPLAGTCSHRWKDQASPYFKAQVCDFCKLYRYKVSSRADWEFRAPIPIAGERGAE